MLIISWAIALIAIMIAGMWAGRALESSRQFTGADRSYGAIGVGCMLAAVQIGGMSMIGAAQNGYNRYCRRLVLGIRLLLLLCDDCLRQSPV